MEIDAQRPAWRVDLAQITTIVGVRVETCETVAEATASASPGGRVGAILAARSRCAIARQPAGVVGATLTARNAAQRVVDGLARALPLLVLAAAGVFHLEGAVQLLRVVDAELPALVDGARACLPVPRRVAGGVLDLCGRCVRIVELVNVVEGDLAPSDLHQLVAALVERQSCLDHEPPRLLRDRKAVHHAPADERSIE